MNDEKRQVEIDAANDAQQERTARIVAEAEQVVTEINEVLAAQDRMFAKHNITQEQLMAHLKKIGGTELEQILNQKLEGVLQEAKARAEQAVQHQQFDAPAAKRSRRLRSLV